MVELLRTLSLLTLGGTGLAVVLLTLRYLLFRKIPSTFYYYAWLLVLIRFLLPIPGMIPLNSPTPAPAPVVQTQAIPTEPAPTIEAEPMEIPIEMVRETAPATPAPSHVVTQPQWELNTILKNPALWLGIWAVGFLFSLFWYILSYKLFSLEIRQHIRSPLDWDEAAFPGKKPPLWLCDGIYSPMLLGLLHPTIVLPEGEYSAETIHNILRHELMHHRRRDILYKWFSVVVFSFQWFNPITYIIRHELNRACELSCDEMIIRGMSKEEKQSYGDTLLTLAANRTLPANLTATTFATEKRNLKERLLQIMRYKISTGTILIAVLALGLLAGLGAILGPKVTSQLDKLQTERNLGGKTALWQGEALAAKADAAFVYELSTDTVMYLQNADTQVHPHGLNHLALALAVLENADPEAIVTVSENDYYEMPRTLPNIKLRSGEQVTVKNLLRAAVGNGSTDAATALAEHISGSTEAFVPLMNQAAKAAGCTSTHYTDVLGLAEDQYTTARDTVRLAMALRSSPEGREIWARHSDWITTIAGELPSREILPYSSIFSFAATTLMENQEFTGGIRTLWTQSSASPSLMVFSVLDEDGTELLVSIMNAPGTGYGPSDGEDDGGKLVSTLLETFDRTEVREGIYCMTATLSVPAQSGLVNLKEWSDGDLTIVSNVNDLLNAIKNNHTIYMKPGNYDLRTASNYAMQGIHEELYRWEQGQYSFQLVIQNVSGLRIVASDPDTNLLPTSRIRFENCTDCSITGINFCDDGSGIHGGDILTFDECQSMTVADCKLDGWAANALVARSCSNLTLTNLDISECGNGISLTSCRDTQITGTTIRNMGRKMTNSNGDALTFTYSSNVTVDNCTIQDSLLDDLLVSSHTSGVKIISSIFSGNTVDCGFRAPANGFLIDGCGFSGNQVEQWLYPDNGPAVTLDGTSLTEQSLPNMVYVKNLTLPQAEEAEMISVTVATADEFLNALGSNRTILLDSNAQIDLSQAAGYGGESTACYRWTPAESGYNLVISGLENLNIVAKDYALFMVSEYANLFEFENCRNVNLSGFSVSINCASTATIQFTGCWVARMENITVTGLTSRAVMVQSTEGILIDSCTFIGGDSGVELFNCKRIEITGSRFEKLHRYGIRMVGCTEERRRDNTFFQIDGETEYIV